MTDTRAGYRDFIGLRSRCYFIGRAFYDNWGLTAPKRESDEVFIEVIKLIEKRIFELET